LYRTDDLLSLTTVPVSVSAVTYDSGSALHDVTEAWLTSGCSTAYGNNQSQDETCQFGSEAVTSSDYFCFNAVKSVAYTIEHDQSSSSTITNVTLQLVVTDVSFLTAASHEGYDLTQTYSVSYSNAPDEAVISADNGNQVPR
jgi:hypothetical protein